MPRALGARKISRKVPSSTERQKPRESAWLATAGMFLLCRGLLDYMLTRSQDSQAQVRRRCRITRFQEEIEVQVQVEKGPLQSKGQSINPLPFLHSLLDLSLFFDFLTIMTAPCTNITSSYTIPHCDSRTLSYCWALRTLVCCFLAGDFEGSRSGPWFKRGEISWTTTYIILEGSFRNSKTGRSSFSFIVFHLCGFWQEK